MATSRIILVAAGLLLLAAAGWFFVSPLFIDRVVDEPLNAGPALPTRAEVAAMPPARRAETMQELMQAAAAETNEIREPMDMVAGPVPVARGRFSDADAVHRGSGRATLYRLDNDSHIVRFEEFRVTNGPALVVLLARHRDPQRAADVETGYTRLGDLKGNVGNQNYAIPREIDVADHGSVVIWCELFDVLFSAAPLREI